ncbi:MAG TPA: sodium:calcium antiporter [Actinomycetota bacterium]|nr:sodium:calcium antiporter [Actinomycetota bacterium]
MPWLGVRVFDLVTGSHTLSPHDHPYPVAILAGLAILGAAYLLSVGAEVAQVDISRSLALAFLALIAILPEYAVDMVFAWKGGDDPKNIVYATANMTGANRLLIGLFWPVVVFVFAIRHKRDRIVLDSPFRLEIFFLLLATAYSFTIPFRRQIHLVDFVLLASMFVWYAIRASKTHGDEPPHLEGVAERIASRGKTKRRRTVLIMFGWAAIGIIAAAEPFAESLIVTGDKLLSGLLGAEQAKFLTVQWVAPLASEFPELVVASMFAIKAMPESALGSLVSSKVNQWTLLIGALPAVYVVSHMVHGHGFTWAMPLDVLQSEEIFLTSAQSLFAAILLVNLDLNVREAWVLLVLFLSQFFLPLLIPAIDLLVDVPFSAESTRVGFSAIYILLGVGVLAVSRTRRGAFIDIIRSRGAKTAVSRG